MTDQNIINEAVSRYKAGEPITDLMAKVITNAYHEGMYSRFYKLASTGAIDNSDGQLGRELEHAEGAAQIHLEVGAIHALRAYIIAKGTRGPQDYWHTITW